MSAVELNIAIIPTVSVMDSAGDALDSLNQSNWFVQDLNTGTVLGFIMPNNLYSPSDWAFLRMETDKVTWGFPTMNWAVGALLSEVTSND